MLKPQPVYYNNTAGTLPKGLPTISWVRVPEATTSTVRAEKSYVLYDAKARVVRTFSNNYLEGYTQVDSQLEPITGRLNHTLITHKRATNATLITLKDDYTYTSQDRLLGHTHTIDNTNPTESLVQNTYDKLGRLIAKNVGGTGTVFLQKVDYSYNIRGWLTGINNPNNLAQNSDPLDLFAFAINYNTPIAINNSSGTITPLYNGNIAETSWRTATDNILRRYGYQYDNLNRLKSASYQKPEAAVTLTSSYDESTTYDKNGNIMSLSRYGDFDDPTQQLNIDNLTYSYANMTNRLMKVTDATNSTIGFKEPTIPNTANSGNDYTYDLNTAGTDIGNGNMTSDYNKGITNIKYNHLNLPIEISFTGTNKITYLYNATGKKLKKVVTSGTTITTTDYLDGFQYNQATATAAVVLQFFPQAEGYVSNTVVAGVNKYSYIYNYTDHLGNVRLSYTKNPTTSALTILEESHYYPSGIKHSKYNIDQAFYNECQARTCIAPVARLPYQYKYNGQEWQDELGLNTTAMDYRQYDNTIGRFSSIDALAELSYSGSPYSFANNNPVYWSDPSGLKPSPGRSIWNFFFGNWVGYSSDYGSGNHSNSNNSSGDDSENDEASNAGGNSQTNVSYLMDFGGAGGSSGNPSNYGTSSNGGGGGFGGNTQPPQQRKTTFEDGLRRVIRDAKVDVEISSDDLVEKYGVPKDAAGLINSFTKVSNNSIKIDWVGGFNVNMMAVNAISDAIFKDGVINVAFLKDGTIRLTGNVIGIKYNSQSYFTLILDGDFARIPQATTKYKWKIGR